MQTASPASSTTSAFSHGSYLPQHRLELELTPSAAAGFLRLGAPVGDVLKELAAREVEVPQVTFSYSDVDPLKFDLVLNLTRNGVCLRFDPKTQRLRLIELYDFSKLWLFYQNTEFNSAKVLPTFVSIYKIFGPTYPGVFQDQQHRYLLNYPGITFIFPVPSKFTPTNNTDLPLALPDGTTPVVNRIYIYSGEQWSNAPPPSTPFNSIDFYFEDVQVVIGQGLKFSRRDCTITFGTPSQEVLAELGRPAQIMFKQDDKMRIHQGFSEGAAVDDYFWNYFDAGIDVVFEGATHTVKKFILHSNIPGHHDFNRYRKCNFKITGLSKAPFNRTPSPTTKARRKAKSGQAEAISILGAELAKENNSRNGTLTESDVIIDSNTQWDVIQQLMGSPLGPPVIFDRGPSNNPFASTSYYGFDGIIFEIMKNGYIASITLY